MSNDISCFWYLSIDSYNVHAKPVYFLDESHDVVYFRGSTFKLHCCASCGQDCIFRNKIYHNGLPDLIHELTDNNSASTLTIRRATAKDSGFYQCFRSVWPWSQADIAGKEIHVQITGA